MLGALVSQPTALEIYPCYNINSAGWNLIGSNMEYGRTIAGQREIFTTHGLYTNGPTAITNFQVGFCWVSISSAVLDNNDWLYMISHVYA